MLFFLEEMYIGGERGEEEEKKNGIKILLNIKGMPCRSRR